MSTPTPTEKREILASAEQGVRVRRRAEVDDLARLLAWADAHSGDPQDEPEAIPVKYGGPRLITIGGEGTPGVNDLCFAEIAVARHAGEKATQNATADALDLRHRLPKFWAGIQQLACEPWVGHKVARMSRKLSREAVKIVDAAVTAAIDESPSRIIAIAEAKIIEADTAAHAQRIADNQAQRGVWLNRPRPGDTVDEADPTAGVRTLTGRLDEADAIELYEGVEDLATALATHGNHDPDHPPSRDQLRADALALLGRPADALALLDGETDQPTDTDAETDPDTDTDVDAEVDTDANVGWPPREDDDTHPARPARPRRDATIFAHLSADAVTGIRTDGVARFEELGPMLLDQLRALLRHRNITLTPVIDLNDTHAVNGYEHPTEVRDRTEQRVYGDAFPHTSARPGTRVDHDHPTPYDRDGPPGQTGDHNDAPLTRRHHRAKTHQPYRVDQLALGAYRWITPHGLARVVTPRGTKQVQLITNHNGDPIGEIYPFPPLRLEWQT